MADRGRVMDLFLLLARQPHHRCLRLGQSYMQNIRFASNLPRPMPDRTVAANSGIPLHVGLDRNPTQRSAFSQIPIPKGEKGEVFTPSVLARPLGLQTPPQPGQNSTRDTRTFAQRRADFSDPEQAKQRQRVLLRAFGRPYYQDRSRTRFHGGKSFIANERLFRRDRALYFPNIWGRTLAAEGDGPNNGRDLAPLLPGKISLISMQQAKYAQDQVATFLDPKHNPELESLISSSDGRVQRIDVNMQPDWFQEMLVWWSRSRIRKTIPEERWSRYFLIKLPRDVRKGLTEDVRDAMGLLNSLVGYVYLVDSSAKVRWAGSGDAWEGEVAGLNAAIQRLIEEERSLKLKPVRSSEEKSQQPEKLVQNIQLPKAVVEA